MKNEFKIVSNNRFNTKYELSENQVLTYVQKADSLYFFGLKVSSRVMEDTAKKLSLPMHNLLIVRGKVLNTQHLHHALANKAQVFLLVRNPREKVYSGLLETSNYKTFLSLWGEEGTPIYKNSWGPEDYKPVLIKFMKSTYSNIQKGGMLDGHFGRYHKSIYLVAKELGRADKYLIDLDTEDFNFNYNILEAKEYEKTYSLRPVIHTNKYGYNIVEEVLKENKDTDWGMFFNKMIAEEESFYRILKSRIRTVSRETFENSI